MVCRPQVANPQQPRRHSSSSAVEYERSVRPYASNCDTDRIGLWESPPGRRFQSSWISPDGQRASVRRCSRTPSRRTRRQRNGRVPCGRNRRPGCRADRWRKSNRSRPPAAFGNYRRLSVSDGASSDKTKSAGQVHNTRVTTPLRRTRNRPAACSDIQRAPIRTSRRNSSR